MALIVTDCIQLLYFELEFYDAYHFALTCKNNFNIFKESENMWSKYLNIYYKTMDKYKRNTQIKRLWNGNYRKTYKRIMQLTQIKKVYYIDNHNSWDYSNYDQSIHEIFSSENFCVTKKLVIESLGVLVNLLELLLPLNGIITFPRFIYKLKNLVKLDLSGNKLTTVPIDIKKLTNLGYLNLSNNDLVTFPSNIICLTRLETLILEDNMLTEIPSEILLMKLRELDISYNAFTELPNFMYKLITLKLYCINNLPLIHFPTDRINICSPYCNIKMLKSDSPKYLCLGIGVYSDDDVTYQDMCDTIGDDTFDFYKN